MVEAKPAADLDSSAAGQVIDFSKVKKKKVKKAKKAPADAAAKPDQAADGGADSAAATPAAEKEFDLNDVPGHTNYDYMFLLDRIEEKMNQKIKSLEESKRSKEEISIVTRIVSTKTSWFGFDDLVKQINRNPEHVLSFFEAELDVKGNPGSEGNLIL